MPRTALLIVDIQNDYFPGGRFELAGAEAAGRRAALILAAFRERGLPVVHIRHEALDPATGFFLPGTPGAEIHPLVRPLDGETVIIKHYPNSFRGTALEASLSAMGVERVAVVGMMTLMCVDATVRAARDMGFEAVVAHDACAARDLDFLGTTVPADHVQAAFLAALGMGYAAMADAASLIRAL